MSLRSTFFTLEEPRTMQAPGWDWAHEIRVALPLSYAQGDRAYPTLWVMDNQLEEALAILGMRDLILVTIGSGANLQEFSDRRTHDYTPGPSMAFDGPGSDRMIDILRGFAPHLALPEATGGARGHIDFLVDVVRPALAAEYRMDHDDHGLVGFSQGGTFVGHALFARPGAFAKYILGSGALWQAHGAIFKLEEEYAASHDDLPAQIFIGSGDAEITEPFIQEMGLVSSTVRLAETLSFRRYPSLQLTVKIFPGESHMTVFPHILSWGVRSLWGETVAPYAQGQEQ
jgi:predicted alpha/beta superfamily hydrolase